jgi:hypothetical protein
MTIRVLVAYSVSSTFTQTTWDYLEAFRLYLGEHILAKVEYLSVTQDPQLHVSLDDYDVVIQSYCARLCFEGYVSEGFVEMMSRYRGLKILAVQDEYDQTNILRSAIRHIDFDIVLTCVPQDSLEYVYPKIIFPTTRFETIFTGYVPECLTTKPRIVLPLLERPIVVGYRGRDIGPLYGQLGFEKFEIGRRMRAICEERRIPHDIAMDEASRIYGDGWYDFIGSCRAMLGSESGSNVFDFDGSIKERFFRMEKEMARRPSFEEFAPFISEREKAISMGQISPRIFECAVMRTPMILFRGRYSDAIEPERHYILLEKNFSNVDDVLARLQQIDDLTEMANRAWQHLVGSARFGYRAFMGRLASIISEEMNLRNIQQRKRDAKVGGIGPYKASPFHAEAPTSAPKPFSAFKAIAKKQSLFQQLVSLEPSSAEITSLIVHCQSMIIRYRKTADFILIHRPELSVRPLFLSLLDILDKAQTLLQEIQKRQPEGVEYISEKRQELSSQIVGTDDAEDLDRIAEALDRIIELRRVPPPGAVIAEINMNVSNAFATLYADVKPFLPLSFRIRIGLIARLRHLVDKVMATLLSKLRSRISPEVRVKLNHILVRKK